MDVLLVDGDPEVVGMAEAACSSLHRRAQLHVARTGAQALALLGAGSASEAGALPGLVVLELQLDDMTGMEVLSRIKTDAWLRSVPVVVFTGSSDACDLRACYRAGANSYIKKPPAPEAMGATVRQLLTYWVAVNEPPVQERQGEEWKWPNGCGS